MHPYVIIAGATASGKSQLAHHLFDGGLFHHLINADSRQIYQHLNIATAKPKPEEINRYNYQLMDFLDPKEKFDTYQYQQMARSFLEQNKQVGVVGGSPFYVESLLKKIPDHPTIPKEIVDYWEKNHSERGILHLQEQLKKLDEEYYNEVDLQNPMRLMRALSYISYFKTKYSDFRKQQYEFNDPCLILIPYLPRAILHKRIDTRVDVMMNEGLVDEVKELIMKGYNLNDPGMDGIGYREVYEYLQKQCSKEDMLENIKTHTKQFAKRQMTWFKRFKGVLFLDMTENKHSKEAWFTALPPFQQDDLSKIVRDKLNFRLNYYDNGPESIKNILRVYYEM